MTLSGLGEAQVLDCAPPREAALMSCAAGIDGARVLGPAPLAILKVNNNYRYRVTLCAPPGSGARRFIADTVIRAGASRFFKGVNVYADTNPSD